jgi:hypothetical protein
MSATTDTLISVDPVDVEQFIARVLGRARRTAQDLGAPDEARTILNVAYAFADELAGADPQFDRMRFIEAAMDSSS